MNPRNFNRRPAFVISTLAIIVASLFIFSSCKKDSISVSAAATISGFSPTSGPEGTVVIISGTHFSTVLSNNTVTFNGMHATVSAATAGQITATVPSGATTGKISVAVAGAGGSAMSSGSFTVTQ